MSEQTDERAAPVDLEELRRAAEKATPGPWEVVAHEDGTVTLRGAERDDWLVRTTARKVLVRLLSSAPVAPRCPAGDPNCMCHAPMDPPPAAPGEDHE
jgi:hypothetical protein